MSWDTGQEHMSCGVSMNQFHFTAVKCETILSGSSSCIQGPLGRRSGERKPKKKKFSLLNVIHSEKSGIRRARISNPKLIPTQALMLPQAGPLLGESLKFPEF